MRDISMFAELLRFNGVYLPKILKGYPPESYFIMPETRGNPMIWLLGHLVLNRGEIVEILGGDPKTSDLGDNFANGTQPSTSPSKYPAPAELIKRFSQLAGLTEHLITRADPALFGRKSWGKFESLGQNLAYSYMHETHHIGQVNYLVNLPSIKSMKRAAASAMTFRNPEKKNSTTKVILEGLKSVFT